MEGEPDPTLALLTVSSGLANVSLGASTWTAPDGSPVRNTVTSARPIRPQPPPPQQQHRFQNRALSAPRVGSGSTQRVWSASSGTGSGTGRGTPLVVHENFALSPRPLTRLERAQQCAAVHREHLNLPPCRPSRVLTSASPVNRGGSSADATGERGNLDGVRLPRPVTSAPTFKRDYTVPQQRGLRVSTADDSAAPPLHGPLSECPKREDLPPNLRSILEDLINSLSTHPPTSSTGEWYTYGTSEAGLIINGEKDASVDERNVFGGLWIRRQEHETYIRQTLERMASAFFEERLPEVYNEVRKQQDHDVRVLPAPTTSGAAALLETIRGASATFAPSKHHPKGAVALPRRVGGPRSEAVARSPCPGFPLKRRDDNESKMSNPRMQGSASYDSPTQLRSQRGEPEPLVSPTALSQAVEARVAQLNTDIEKLQADLDAKLKEQERWSLNDTSKANDDLKTMSADVTSATQEEPFACTVPFETNIQSAMDGREHGRGDTGNSWEPTATSPALSIGQRDARLANVVNLVRRRSTNPFEKLERMLRFRQQATFTLRRKLHALLDKKRPGNPLSARFFIHGDRETLSMQVPGRSPSATPSAAVSPPMTGLGAPQDSYFVAPIESPVVVDGQPSSGTSSALNPPFLTHLELYEVPTHLKVPLLSTQRLHAEYHELASAVKRSQTYIHTLTKGTVDEKKKVLVELGIQLPTEAPSSPSSSPKRRASSMFRGAGRRCSGIKNLIGSGKGGKRRGSPQRKDQQNANQHGLATSPSGRSAFCDAAVQTTLDEEVLLILYHRVEFLFLQQKAYRDMWASMYVALKNISHMWEDIEVDLSCARCKGLLVDAMIISPCGTTVCGDCLRYDDEDSLLQYERPDCGCLNHEGSMPNKWMRRFCKGFAVRDIPGAITAVPSESVLGELEYQLKVVGDAMGLIKSSKQSSPRTRESADARRVKGAPGQSTADPTSVPGGGGSGGILVASTALQQRKRGTITFGGKNKGGSERRKRSVVIKGLDDGSDNSDTEVAGNQPSSQSDDKKAPTTCSHPMASILQLVGAEEFSIALQEHNVQLYKRKISNAVHRQFRR